MIILAYLIPNIVNRITYKFENTQKIPLYINLDLTFEERQAYFINLAKDSGDRTSQIVKAYLNMTLNDQTILKQADKVLERTDGQDFRLVYLLRILYLEQGKFLMKNETRNYLKTIILGAKYWFTEPGEESAIYWTENHQITCHTAELLAGQLYKNEIFPNSGMTGLQHIEHATQLINSWFDKKARFGFTEWHSNDYENIVIAALTSLIEFSENQDVATKSAMLLDLIAFGYATLMYQDLYATSHGRAYDKSKVGEPSGTYHHRESTGGSAWILLGIGGLHPDDLSSSGAIGLAISEQYRTPPVLEKIARDALGSIEHRERNSIYLNEANKFGIGYESMEDMMWWWAMAAVIAPEIVDKTNQYVEKYNLDTNILFGPPELMDVFKAEARLRGITLAEYCEIIKQISRGIALETANTYTYRTPHYQLSGVQDHQKGWNSFQEFIWQATLDSDAYIFTSSPSGICKAPGEWIGGWSPRATLQKNVGIIQYDREPMPIEAEIIFAAMDAQYDDHRGTYLHAYFPRWAFDEIKDQGRWHFGRRGDSYVALYSHELSWWESEFELRVLGKKNLFICELGSVEEFGSFSNFISKIRGADLKVRRDILGYSVNYQSPSLGAISVSWDGDFMVNGAKINLGDYARFDNRYCYQDFNTMRTSIELDGQWLELDFDSVNRTYST